jgi:hypothetical protein
MFPAGCVWVVCATYVVIHDGIATVAPALLVVATTATEPFVVVVAKLCEWLLCAAVVSHAGTLILKPLLLAVTLRPLAVSAEFSPIASVDARAVVSQAGTPTLSPALLCVPTNAVPAVVAEVNPAPAMLPDAAVWFVWATVLAPEIVIVAEEPLID